MCSGGGGGGASRSGLRGGLAGPTTGQEEEDNKEEDGVKTGFRSEGGGTGRQPVLRGGDRFDTETGAESGIGAGTEAGFSGKGGHQAVAGTVRGGKRADRGLGGVREGLAKAFEVAGAEEQEGRGADGAAFGLVVGGVTTNRGKAAAGADCGSEGKLSLLRMRSLRLTFSFSHRPKLRPAFGLPDASSEGSEPPKTTSDGP